MSEPLHRKPWNVDEKGKKFYTVKQVKSAVTFYKNYRNLPFAFIAEMELTDIDATYEVNDMLDDDGYFDADEYNMWLFNYTFADVIE